MQDFCPRINMLERIFFKTILWWIMVCQKVPKLHFQNQFSMSKIDGIFSKTKSLKIINLGDHYLLKYFFSKLNFWTTLLSKITLNFWQTVITLRNFLKIFPWWHVDSWPKILPFRTHHLWNSMTELILIYRT